METKEETSNKPVWKNTRGLGFISVDAVVTASGWKPGDGELLQYLRNLARLKEGFINQ